MTNLQKRQVFFVIVFALLGLLALQIKLTNLAGSKASFTMFDAFAPIAGSFLGSLPGVIAVLLMQAFNFFVHGTKALDIGTIIRFIPPLFATLYFAKKTKLNFIIPLVAIIIFNSNPVGRSVWYYSLFWLIPVAGYFVQERWLFAKALGATFTAHAVGGAMWIYAFHLPKAVWVSLIPVVAIERLIFAIGMVGSYVLVTNVLNLLMQKKIITYQLPLNPTYIWKWTNSAN